MKVLKILSLVMLSQLPFQVAAQENVQLVRLAKLVIDSAQLDAYNTFF